MRSLILFCLCLVWPYCDSFVTLPNLSRPRLSVPEQTVHRRGRAELHKHYGIPKLFRWLVDLYPIVIESVGEGLSEKSMQVDNFYLDMNGIIHTCTHSNNDKLIVYNEKDMFQKIFRYTDRLYKLVKPKNKMFLAIDGVAPRAKMNQQRSRRFRSSKERAALMADHVAREGRLPDDESFDSNCITPGTDFMFRLGIAFRQWIEYKMKTDPFYQNGAEIVFSGPDVPGEGEHKVMDMVRWDQQNDPNYKGLGSLKHCMYGLDADLIMLSLVTHEPKFILLREKILKRNQKKKETGSFSPEDFEILEITILRKMLETHFKSVEKDFKKITSDAKKRVEEGDLPATALATMESFTLERVVDDFVFMCIFVGNDFLPCLPHLDIADGSLNLMMNVYRDLLPTLGGFLTDKSKIHLPRLELFLQEISRREPLYFQQRSADEKEPRYNDDDYKKFYYEQKFGFTTDMHLTESMSKRIWTSDTAIAEHSAAITGGSTNSGVEGDGVDEPEFYQGVTLYPTFEENKQQLVQSYIEGLCWVLEYYHNGCGSWTWYYPYLYAPLASDLKNLASLKLEFETGEPFTPLLQLLSVLPPQSGPFLPKQYEELMVDLQSPIKPYYPEDFSVDANGKKNSWECVVQIPFLSESALVDAVSSIDHKSLSKSERLRNIPGMQHHFVPINHGKGMGTDAPAATSKKKVRLKREN